MSLHWQGHARRNAPVTLKGSLQDPPRICTPGCELELSVTASTPVPVTSDIAISPSLATILAMSRDSTFTYLHLHASHHADLLEDFTRSSLKLPAEDIYVPPQHQPINPDDDEEVVPDQHAAFGIQRATQKGREPAWKDLGLEALMSAEPPARQAAAGASAGNAGRAGSGGSGR